MNFKNKVVWITGASSGIGEHLAYAFAEQDAKLILSSRNERELLRVRENCQNDDATMVLPLDVADFDAIPIAVEKIIEKFGNIDILINNAGISQRSLIKDTTFEVDRKIMSVNYLGTVAITKAVLPVMIRQASGQIVVISSVMGKIGVPYRSAYAASKHALHGYFDSLRGEVFRNNIKVTIICPGYVRTNVTINALVGDGSKSNVMAVETSKGMDPAIFAQKALRAIYHKKEEAYIGSKEILAIYVKRYLPWLLSYVTKRMNFRPQAST